MANTTEIKVTRVMALAKAIEVLNSVEGTSEYVEVLEKIKTSVAKKSTSKADEKKAAENQSIKDCITEVLANGKMRNGDIRKAVNESMGTDYSDSKISRMVTEMKNDGIVIRTLDKKVAYFELA